MAVGLIDKFHSWREMIANGAINDVLNEMLEAGVKDENEIILLSSQYERYRSEKIKGTLSYSEVEKIRNSIESNILDFIDKSKEKIKKSEINNNISQNSKIEFSITIEAKFPKEDQSKINAIIYNLMNITSDYSIQFKGVESGSIKIYLTTEKVTYENILDLFNKKMLNQVIDAEVIDIKEAKFPPSIQNPEKMKQPSESNPPRATLAGLCILVMVLGFTLLYLNLKIQPSLSITDDPTDPKNFPMEDYYKYIFSADGQFKIQFDKINHTLLISGTGFLDNKGHLVTAHHIIKPIHYPESALEAEIQLNEARFAPITNYKFYSPKAVETCYDSDLNWGFASPDPNYPLSWDLYDKYKEFSNILIDNKVFPITKSHFMQYRSCAPAEDWAVAKPSALKKLSKTSPIVIDRDFARNLTEHTPLVSLGYRRNGQSKTPQLKYMELAVIKKSKDNDFPLFLVVNPDFGSGDSGSPVFAYKKEGNGKGKWVVVGIVIAKRFYSDSDSWGIILPAYCITENYLN